MLMGPNYYEQGLFWEYQFRGEDPNNHHILNLDVPNTKMTIGTEYWQ